MKRGRKLENSKNSKNRDGVSFKELSLINRIFIYLDTILGIIISANFVILAVFSLYLNQYFSALLDVFFLLFFVIFMLRMWYMKKWSMVLRHFTR